MCMAGLHHLQRQAFFYKDFFHHVNFVAALSTCLSESDCTWLPWVLQGYFSISFVEPRDPFCRSHNENYFWDWKCECEQMNPALYRDSCQMICFCWTTHSCSAQIKIECHWLWKQPCCRAGCNLERMSLGLSSESICWTTTTGWQSRCCQTTSLGHRRRKRRSKD